MAQANDFVFQGYEYYASFSILGLEGDLQLPCRDVSTYLTLFILLLGYYPLDYGH